ncbi:50S ribosomal protein L6 [bacterium]|nr:50S ribosomal protein L6 [bacterium]
MSRLAKKPLIVPDDVEVKIEQDQGQRLLKVSGPLGSLERALPHCLIVNQKGNSITLRVRNIQNKKQRAILGTMVRVLNNMIIGVKQGFEKSLELVGVGYRAELQGDKLVLQLGFSHPVEYEIPQGIKISVEKNVVKIQGASKELVGETAAQIRRFRPPEPYKGTGIRYVGEEIKTKVGKKATTAAK